MSIKASADNIVTQMSISDTRALFGDSISGTVKSSSGTAWTQCTFSYVGSVSSVSVSGMNLDVNDFANNVSQFPDYGAIIYSCPVSAVSSYYDFILDIPVYFPDYALGAIGISNMLDGHSWSGITQSGNVVSSYPDNYYSGFDAVAAREPSTVYGAYLYNNSFYRLFPYLVDSNGEYLFSLHVQSVRSYASNGQPCVFMMIFCPNVGSLPSNTEPVSTTTTTDSGAGSVTTVSGGDINVDVNIDLDETNSILEDILEGISSFVTDIIEGVVYIFKPVDDDYIENWLDDMADVISEAFSDKVDIDILRDILIDLGSYGATTSIEFPSFSIGDYTFPARAVALRPAGFDSLFNLVETAINLVCTIWVFNMVLMRIKAVFVGESVVEVEGDVE